MRAGLPPAGLLNGEGGSQSAGRSSATLDDVMRGPSTNVPDVVVIDSMPEELARKDILDPKEDLWLTTSDGRYNAPIIPLTVGQPPFMETFYVHKNILLRAEYFKRALCGNFKERESQSLDLPEEDPHIFHFLVAFLYEGRFIPIKPVATVLAPELAKGKGKSNDVINEVVESDSESGVSLLSDTSASSRRRRNRRRRQEERHQERLRSKHPGMHRVGCGCPQCLSAGGPPCWHCAAPRVPPPPAPMPHPHPHGAVVMDPRDRSRRRHGRGPPPPPYPPPDLLGGDRIKGEDLRTWLLTYDLSLEVYICANKFLMEEFKREVARACIDMLETAGSDAAQVEVLQLCKKLYEGLSENDPLLKMIFARVGFLQPILWSRAPEQTSQFLVCNAEVASLILKETASRRQDEFNGRTLPSMERLGFPNVPFEAPYLPRGHRPPRF